MRQEARRCHYEHRDKYKTISEKTLLPRNLTSVGLSLVRPQPLILDLDLVT